MRTIYNGGFLPALAIDDSPESPSWGWLMAKNPLDGQWVTIANLSAQITAQTDDVIDAQIAALTTTPEYQAMVKDAERIDKMQELFVKGEDTHILMCEGHDMDECDHPTHPHFEAFDWNWRVPPVRGVTLREVMDAAIDAARAEHE